MTVRGDERMSPIRADLEIAAVFLADEQLVNLGEHVVFRCEGQGVPASEAERKVQLPPEGGGSLTARVGGASEKILTDQGIVAWIKQENDETIKKIVLSFGRRPASFRSSGPGCR